MRRSRNIIPGRERARASRSCSHSRRIGSWAVVLFTVAPGCGSEELPPIVQRSERLVLRAPVEQTICAGTFASMEAEVIELQDRFGVAPTLVDYAWMPESNDDADALPCQLSDFACSIGERVYARTLGSTHELVHASRPSLPAVLEEGLATLLSVPQTDGVDDMVSREELLSALELGTWEQSSDGAGLYERSAHFVSFLIAAWGEDAFIEFDARVRGASSNRDQPLTDWAGDFEVVYALSFAQAWADYADYPDCTPPQFHRPLTACALIDDGSASASLRPAFMTDTENATFLDPLACTDDYVVGPRQLLDGTLARVATFAVEVDNWIGGSVHVELTGDVTDASRAVLTNCGDCWSGAASLLSSTPPEVLLSLPSGVYALVLHGAFDDSEALGVRLAY